MWPRRSDSKASGGWHAFGVSRETRVPRVHTPKACEPARNRIPPLSVPWFRGEICLYPVSASEPRKYATRRAVGRELFWGREADLYILDGLAVLADEADAAGPIVGVVDDLEDEDVDALIEIDVLYGLLIFFDGSGGVGGQDRFAIEVDLARVVRAGADFEAFHVLFS